jgi:hypothetical protein
MKSRDFCFWLQGYLEITAADASPMNEPLTSAQVNCIRKHLALVFVHEIDPTMSEPAPKTPHEQKLDAVYALLSARHPPPTMGDFKKLGRQKDIRPEIAALVARGNITREEVKDLRCNADEWNAIRLASDDDAFVDAFEYALKNCGNHARPITYEDSVVEIFAPDLLRRFALKRLELAAQVPVLLEAVEENLRRALKAEQEVAGLKKAYEAVDANWASAHAAAMDPIREACGDPDATVPDIVAMIRNLRLGEM